MFMIRFSLLCTLCIFYLMPFSSNANIIWAEGKCDNGVFEGATRDYYNRGAYLPWQHTLGDWQDSEGSQQGDTPFTTITAYKQPYLDIIAQDVTELVKKWQSKEIPQQGFFLKHRKGGKIIVYSKDSNKQAHHPKLIITTPKENHTLSAIADTELRKSTYKCLGGKDKLHLVNHTLILFDLTNIKENITSASLELTLASASIKASEIDIYAVHTIPSLLESGILVTDNQEKDKDKKQQIYLIENFEDDSWENNWTISSGGKHRIVKANKKENFQPIHNNALEITIKKGRNKGIGARFFLDEIPAFIKNGKRNAYFRYNLRFGEHWRTQESGKLPGFAGTYQGESFKGGWGGRPSKGDNGWSARGYFSETISSGNPLSNQIPIGNYIYHADMKDPYGDETVWYLNPLSVIKKNQWYSVEQFIKLNSIGKNDGEIKTWVNGELAFYKKELKFSDNPNVNLESVWLNVYHGGKKKADRDLVLFIDDLIIASDYIGPDFPTIKSCNYKAEK